MFALPSLEKGENGIPENAVSMKKYAATRSAPILWNSGIVARESHNPAICGSLPMTSNTTNITGNIKKPMNPLRTNTGVLENSFISVTARDSKGVLLENPCLPCLSTKAPRLDVGASNPDRTPW